MRANLLSMSSKKEEQTSTLHLGVFQFYVFGLCLNFTVCWRYAKKKGQSTGSTQKKQQNERWENACLGFPNPACCQKWGCCCSMAPRPTRMKAGFVPAISTYTARDGNSTHTQSAGITQSSSLPEQHESLPEDVFDISSNWSWALRPASFRA